MSRSKGRKARSEAVIDTTCLTCLLYLGHLEKLIHLYEIFRIPRHVWNEVYQWNDELRRKYPKRPNIYQLQSSSRGKHTILKKCTVVDALRVNLLTDRKQNPKSWIDRGEAEVIIQASELLGRGHNVSEVLIDERKGTGMAKDHGLSVRGTAGVLALLKRDRIIRDDVGGLIEKCRNDIGFFITDDVINLVLKEYGVE